MRGPQSFYRPRPSRVLLQLAEWLTPAVLRRRFGIRSVEIAAEDLDRLRCIRAERAVVTPNHPSLAEPPVVWNALRRAGAGAHFMASWESFACFGKLASWTLRHLGCYSVLRGRRDRAAMQMTNELLVKGERIVIFPEGETYGLNDVLLPFQPGVAQMALRAQEDLLQAGLDAPVFLVPVGIRYTFLGSMEVAMDASLRRLESRLKLQSGGMERYDRLAQVANAVVGALERDYHVTAPEGATINERVNRLRDELLESIAQALRTELPRSARFPDRLRALYNAYYDLTFPAEDGAESAYERGLRRQKATAARPLYKDWDRLHNFIAIRGDYVLENPTQDRFAEVLGRLEKEVLGRSEIHGPRRARLRVGEPIDLREHLAAFQRNRRDTVASLTRELETRVAELVAAPAGPGSARNSSAPSPL